MTPIRISSFAKDGQGGNPAGVVISPALPSPQAMQAIAADLGYSETVFAARDGSSWRVRYYAPVCEVPFCGHATIALGAALGAQEGAGTFALNLRDTDISVEAMQVGDEWHAALQSPQTRSKPMPVALRDQLLTLFGLTLDDLSRDLPPIMAFAGVLHGVLALKCRAQLAAMDYPFEEMKTLMEAHDLVTINLLHITGPRQFASRNAFASGGVFEDPATGAAAAALGGALVDLDWDGLQAGGGFDVVQGEDMGQPSAIKVEVTGVKGASVRVSGAVRWIGETG